MFSTEKHFDPTSTCPFLNHTSRPSFTLLFTYLLFLKGLRHESLKICFVHALVALIIAYYRIVFLKIFLILEQLSAANNEHNI